MAGSPVLWGALMGGIASFHGGVAVRATYAVFRETILAASVTTLMVPGIAVAQQTSNLTGVALPEIHVIATTPVPPPRSAPAAAAGATSTAAPETAATAVPGAVEQDKIPSNVQVLSAPAFDQAKAPDLLQAMVRGLPFVSLSDQTGNQFQLDLNYRGFIASPVIGTPQGLAVYQNGVRINEVFGDIVNWDFIPQNAINQLTLVPSNPVYGLNAIGGALAFEMKNGFTWHGFESEVMGGSYGRIGTSVQAGGQVGNLSGYITADAIDDAGWRQELAIIATARVCRFRRARRQQHRISRHLHRRRQQFRCRSRDAGTDARPKLVEHLYHSTNNTKSARVPDGEWNLEAKR